jgi:hypothetical protein
MEYIKRYDELYPEDGLVVIGGMADHLHLAKCGIDDDPKDIDVNIWSDRSGKTIFNSWIGILPSSYSHNYDANYPLPDNYIHRSNRRLFTN